MPLSSLYVKPKVVFSVFAFFSVYSPPAPKSLGEVWADMLLNHKPDFLNQGFFWGERELETELE